MQDGAAVMASGGGRSLLIGSVAAVMALDKHPLQAGGFELLELGEVDGVFGPRL